MEQQLTRNLGMELVRATEAAAVSAARWLGKGDKNAADRAAVDAMRRQLSVVSMDGVVVIGEGEKDEAPMLYVGEHIGNGQEPHVDIAVDPIDGTRLTALGMGGAIAVVAAAPRGSMYSAPPGIYYMDKIVVGPEAADKIDITRSVRDNIMAVANSKNCDPGDVTVVVLDRPRHEKLIREIREAGARIRLITDGDVAGAIAAANGGSGADMLLGVGGAPEAVVTACAIKAIGGNMQCRLYPRNDEERQLALDNGADMDMIFGLNDLVSSDDVYFAATGITTGDLLRGVTFQSPGATTYSLVMRGQTGTVRRIEADHQRDKLARFWTR